MFASMQSRLWLTYLILIFVVLTLVASGVIVSLANNPIMYRDSAQRIRSGMAEVTARIDLNKKLDLSTISVIAREVSGSTGIRLMLIGQTKQIIFDTQTNGRSNLNISRINKIIVRNPYEDTRLRLIRDNSKRIWLFMIEKISDDLWLIAAVPAPTLGVAAILKDEFIGPIFWSGVVGIFTAFLLSFLLSRWVSKPLQKITEASKKLASGSYQRIPLEGPLDIREVAESFNEMSSRIQEIQTSQKKFIADVSHELKTPLTSIQGFSRALLDGTITNQEEFRDAADVIFSESDRMSKLVADLLTLAKIDSGADVLNLAPVDLNQLLKEIVVKFHYQAEKDSIVVEDKIPHLPIIHADKDKLNQVFSNLLDNAIKYSLSPGNVNLTGYSGKDMVEIQVIDSGVGLSESDQKHIFDRFFQVDKSRRSSSGKGAGLGLSISKEVIEAHGGTITVQSSPGKGSTFTVKLPL